MNKKQSSLKLQVRFVSDPFQKLFSKFRSVNSHGISEWGLLALYGHKEILVNSSLRVTKKMARVISKIQVSDPGPSWPSYFFKKKKSKAVGLRLVKTFAMVKLFQ